ncbi:TPA: deoxyuridine 5'-triphosphate nucleotidohydrolase [Candidatus Micrarchaeota archaeon]|nr:deoxyuridine 5'-triphosphate nucleotidohydrolase [Candidatus Micrarchaeota archaeon]HIH30935.1 deoxyuridine 5'-triphosphate nucleotidohydrolase [Candidatus Micrarchaeota archaeon]
MVIPGSIVLQAKCVADIVNASQVQPAGIDLTLKEVQRLEEEGEIDFDNSRRRISKASAMGFDAEGKIRLPPGCYKIIYNEYVEIPLYAAAFGFPRSSLLRCGADVRCAVWDPGYHGRSESLLLVHNPKGIVLHKNAKVMQLVFVRMEAKAEKGYEGKYKGENR